MKIEPRYCKQAGPARLPAAQADESYSPPRNTFVYSFLRRPRTLRTAKGTTYEETA